MLEKAAKKYRQYHNDSLLGKRVAECLYHENEAGKAQAEFEIHQRCATAERKARK